MDDHVALVQSGGGHREGSEIRVDGPGGAQIEDLGRGGVVSEIRNEGKGGSGQQDGSDNYGGDGLFHDFQGRFA